MCACQLILTVGLLAVVVYLYTVVAFNFFRKFYNKSVDKDIQDMKCNDMLTVSLMCILTHTLPPHISASYHRRYLFVLIFIMQTQPPTSFSTCTVREVEEGSDRDPHCSNENSLMSYSIKFFFYKMMDTLRENSPRSLSTALCLATQNINTPLPALF